MTVGNIPENVSYHVVITGDKNPAFPRDSSNKKTGNTAEEWVNRKTGKAYWDHEKKEYPEPKHKTIIQTEENKPQRGYKIVDLEVRDEGGRAYKVVTPHGYYVDLREDTLMDVIKNHGILAGGELNTELVWATVGSQFKLIVYNGELYNQLLQNMSDKATKPISPKDLEVGTIYVNTKGEQFLYLGLINGFDYENDYRGYGYQREWIQTKVDKKSYQLWFQIPSYRLDLEISPQNIAGYYFYLTKIKSKKVIRKVKNVSVDRDAIREALRNFRVIQRDSTRGICHSYYDWEIVK